MALRAKLNTWRFAPQHLLASTLGTMHVSFPRVDGPNFATVHAWLILFEKKNSVSPVKNEAPDYFCFIFCVVKSHNIRFTTRPHAPRKSVMLLCARLLRYHVANVSR
jgi:hypothetical protein